MEELSVARQKTDELFAIVKSDALYDRPIPERHRIIFYIGHLKRSIGTFSAIVRLD